MVVWPWNASFRISSGGHYTVAFNRRALSSHLDLANSPLVLRKVPCLGFFFFFFPDKHLLCPSVTDLLAEMPPNRDPPRTSFRWGWEVQSALHTQPPCSPSSSHSLSRCPGSIWQRQLGHLAPGTALPAML